MSYMENDSQIQFRLPAELKTILMARAKKQGLNISAFLREAIYEFLALHPEIETPVEVSKSNDSTYAFRVPNDLRVQYLDMCDKAHINPPAPLRKAMRDVIKEINEELSSSNPATVSMRMSNIPVKSKRLTGLNSQQD